MANLAKAEKVIDDFLQHALFSGNLEKGFFEHSGNDAFLLLNNGFSFENLTYDELLRIAVLITREMKAEINNDLKYFWAFSSYITYRQNEEKLFKDLDWRSAFCLLINLVLSSKRTPEIMTSDAKSILRAREEFDRLLSRGVNAHFLEVESKRWELSAPLAFSVLEGLLRRKNGKVVNLNGIVKRNFTIIKSDGTSKNFSIGKCMNRIGDALNCFEQVTIPKRKRACKHLAELKAELSTFSPQTSDIFELVDHWRNELLHGERYWAPKIPLVLNLICFLMIDEIKPKVYNSKRLEIQRGIKFWFERRGMSMPEWSLYPPDL
jgi:hypothetical protein